MTIRSYRRDNVDIQKRKVSNMVILVALIIIYVIARKKEMEISEWLEIIFAGMVLFLFWHL